MNTLLEIIQHQVFYYTPSLLASLLILLTLLKKIQETKKVQLTIFIASLIHGISQITLAVSAKDYLYGYMWMSVSLIYCLKLCGIIKEPKKTPTTNDTLRSD